MWLPLPAMILNVPFHQRLSFLQYLGSMKVFFRISSLKLDKLFSSKFDFDENTGKLRINSRELNCGRFQTVSCGTLRERMKSLPKPGNGTFNIIAGNGNRIYYLDCFFFFFFFLEVFGFEEQKIKQKKKGWILAGRTTELELIDVGLLQANTANAGAVFQVASNFNCLELVSPTERPHTITQYVW